MDFQESAPVKRAKTGGKAAAVNPFTTVISEIALQVYPAEHKWAGLPVSRTYIEKHANAAAVKTDRNRISRQTSVAGGKNDPPVTVNLDFDDANTEVKKGKETVTEYATRVTFWTVKRQNRPRKATATPVSK